MSNCPPSADRAAATWDIKFLPKIKKKEEVSRVTSSTMYVDPSVVVANIKTKKEKKK